MAVKVSDARWKGDERRGPPDGKLGPVLLEGTLSRKLKPEISRSGMGGRPIDDEIEFEFVLDSRYDGSSAR
jgi:hypothetical protein